jgi:hypothetical protein
MLGYYDLVSSDEVGMMVGEQSITANLFYRGTFI